MLILCSARLLAFESPITFNYFRMKKKRKTVPSFWDAFNCSWEANSMGLGTIRKCRPKKKAPSRCLLRRMQSSLLKREGNRKPAVGSRSCIAHYSVSHAIFQSYSASHGRSRWGRTRNAPSPRYWSSFSLPIHKLSSVCLSNLLAFPPPYPTLEIRRLEVRRLSKDARLWWVSKPQFRSLYSLIAVSETAGSLVEDYGGFYLVL